MDDFEIWFEQTCKDIFKFLMDDYGFEYSGVQKLGYILIACSFKTEKVEISASYDKREGYVSVGMSPLNNGKSDGIYDVEWLLILNKSETKINNKASESMKKSISSIFNIYRDVLLKYGKDVLKGNNEFIYKIREKIKKREDEHPERSFPLKEGETVEDARKKLEKARENYLKLKRGELEDLEYS